MERERAIGEYEAMLNSSPWKGIIDTGCAKVMMGSDTFKQYLDLLTSKERASVEKVREKNRFRFGDNETRTSQDLGKGQVTFNELGVTMNLGESSTGHYVIDLISEREPLTTAPGSVINILKSPWKTLESSSRTMNSRICCAARRE